MTAGAFASKGWWYWPQAWKKGFMPTKHFGHTDYQHIKVQL